MAVLDRRAAVDHVNTVTPSRVPSSLPPSRRLRVEPMLQLDWFRAIEPTGPVGAARRPAQTRRAWIHRAPEGEVVKLFLTTRAALDDVPAPWWLRALAEGEIRSRIGGFAIEDQVGDILDSRSGWAYVPWTGPGEDGYWEYLPSETSTGTRLVPTTVVLTDRHSGWLDAVAAHEDTPPAPRPINGLAELRTRIGELEQGTLW